MKFTNLFLSLFLLVAFACAKSDDEVKFSGSQASVKIDSTDPSSFYNVMGVETINFKKDSAAITLSNNSIIKAVNIGPPNAQHWAVYVNNEWHTYYSLEDDWHYTKSADLHDLSNADYISRSPKVDFSIMEYTKNSPRHFEMLASIFCTTLPNLKYHDYADPNPAPVVFHIYFQCHGPMETIGLACALERAGQICSNWNSSVCDLRTVNNTDDRGRTITHVWVGCCSE